MLARQSGKEVFKLIQDGLDLKETWLAVLFRIHTTFFVEKNPNRHRVGELETDTFICPAHGVGACALEMFYLG